MEILGLEKSLKIYQSGIWNPILSIKRICHQLLASPKISIKKAPVNQALPIEDWASATYTKPQGINPFPIPRRKKPPSGKSPSLSTKRCWITALIFLNKSKFQPEKIKKRRTSSPKSQTFCPPIQEMPWPTKPTKAPIKT